MTQISHDNSKNLDKIMSRKSSHKRTNSIETSERSEKQTKSRFLVSKKYNKRMVPARAKATKDTAKTYLGNSMKFSKYQYSNNTNIFDLYTPTSTSSQKVNLKGSLITKKHYDLQDKKTKGRWTL